MKNLMYGMLIIFAGIVGLGFYQGWFHFATRDTADRSRATLTVDKGKIKVDGADIEEQAKALGAKAEEKIKALGAKAEEKIKDLGAKAEEKIKDLGTNGQ